MNKDTLIMRELAKKTMEIASDPIQDQRRVLWSNLNSLKTHDVPIYILDHPDWVWCHMHPELECNDPLYRKYEQLLKFQLYRATMGDDVITEPYITMKPFTDRVGETWKEWGMTSGHATSENSTHAFHLIEHPERTMKDIEDLVIPEYQIDEKRTAEELSKLQFAVGDIIPVHLDTYPQFSYGLSYLMALFFGVENMLYTFYDNPEILHAFSDKIASNGASIFDTAERKGWFSSINNTFGQLPEVQAMAYNSEIASPDTPTVEPMKRRWIFDAAQECENISPEMYNEFILEYMKPIYERFGLLGYGCCENLTQKLPYLMKVKNLRRVAVTPWADTNKCAEILGNKYVISWRPNPSEMISNGFDKNRIINVIKNAKEIFERNNCFWEINLKDVITVEGDESRYRRWVDVVRSVL